VTAQRSLPRGGGLGRSLVALPFALSLACQGTSGAPAPQGGAPGQQNLAGASGAGEGVGGSGTGGRSAGSGGAGNGGTATAGAASSAAGANGGGVGGASGSAGNANRAGSAGAAGFSGGASVGYCSPRPGLLFCDDFEKTVAGTAPTGPWSSVVIGDGTVTVDANVHHGGSQSMHVNGSGYSTMLVFHDPAILPDQKQRFFIRAFIRLIAPMSSEHNSFLIADHFAMPGTGNNLRLGEMHAMLMYTVAGDAHGALANDNFYNDGLPGAALTESSFGCLELLIDPTTPELDVWLDGKEIPDLHHRDFPLDAYDALRFGFEKYGGPQRELWFDDIAIGSEKIGCN